MSPTQSLPLLTRPAKLLSGALALLLLCGAALLGGGATGGIKIGADQGRRSSGADVPLVSAAAYPKDCKRNADPRWRPQSASDDLNDSDPTAAFNSHPGLLPGKWLSQQPLFSHNHSHFQHRPHNPQAARAPPLV